MALTIVGIMDTSAIGARIRELREAHGWSQRQLGVRAGMKGAYISLLESGKRSNPSIEVLSKIARALGVSAEEFLHEGGGEDTVDQDVLDKEIERLVGYYPDDVQVEWRPLCG